MNKKTSTTLLHEYLQARKLPLPTYTFEQVPGGQFKCRVQAAGKVAIGISTSKKLAKQEGSRILFNSLQTKPPIKIASPYIPQQSIQYTPYLNFAPVQQSSATAMSSGKPQSSSGSYVQHNYVGELNEYASKRGIAYPSYGCLPCALNSTDFIFSCTFMNYQALGKGKTKKEAKQDSAKNMLKLYLNGSNDVNKNVGCGCPTQGNANKNMGGGSKTQGKEKLKQKTAAPLKDKLPKNIENIVNAAKKLSIKTKSVAYEDTKSRNRVHIILDLPN